MSTRPLPLVREEEDAGGDAEEDVDSEEGGADLVATSRVVAGVAMEGMASREAGSREEVATSSRGDTSRGDTSREDTSREDTKLPTPLPEDFNHLTSELLSYCYQLFRLSALDRAFTITYSSGFWCFRFQLSASAFCF